MDTLSDPHFSYSCLSASILQGTYSCAVFSFFFFLFFLLEDERWSKDRGWVEARGEKQLRLGAKLSNVIRACHYALPLSGSFSANAVELNLAGSFGCLEGRCPFYLCLSVPHSRLCLPFTARLLPGSQMQGLRVLYTSPG